MNTILIVTTIIIVIVIIYLVYRKNRKVEIPAVQPNANKIIEEIKYSIQSKSPTHGGRSCPNGQVWDSFAQVCKQANK